MRSSVAVLQILLNVKVLPYPFVYFYLFSFLIGPATAFFRYSKDVRPQVVKENPNVRVTEIAKIIGAKWRALPPAEKEKYFKQAKEELDRYKQMTKK